MADCTCSDRYYQAQVHAEGCPSLLSKAPDNHTNAIQPDLIERLCDRTPSRLGSLLINPDGPEAADYITTLQAQLERVT